VLGGRARNQRRRTHRESLGPEPFVNIWFVVVIIEANVVEKPGWALVTMDFTVDEL
jgi:ABC-type thiamin/hydroxymethylpyrimidine transport system permease subunit